MFSRISLLRLLLMIPGFMLLAAPLAHARHAGYPEWQKPQRCVFGMPYVGRAVKSGETGMITEILKEIFEEEGIEFEHRNLPYKQALSELKQGTAQCSLALKDAHDFQISGKAAVGIFNLAVAYRANETFQKVNDLKDQRVGCLYGFRYEYLLPVKVRAQATYDLTSALQLLDQEHVKYILDEEYLIREALLETKMPTCEFGITRIASLEIHPVFAPTKTGREFRAIYDRRMKEMAESGRLEEILKAYDLSAKDIKALFRINGY